MELSSLLILTGLVLVVFALGYKLGLKQSPTSDKSNYRK